MTNYRAILWISKWAYLVWSVTACMTVFYAIVFNMESSLHPVSVFIHQSRVLLFFSGVPGMIWLTCQFFRLGRQAQAEH